MTPEHKFQLFIALLAVVPATLLSWWALVSHRHRTTPRLQVLPSPIMMSDVTGKQVFVNEWPGIVVRNLSPFPQKVCNVGYRIGDKFFTFGRPLSNVESTLVSKAPWPREIEPRSRAAFYLDLNREGRDFVAAITPVLKGQSVLEIGRAYAFTESGEKFYSKRLSRKSRREFQKVRPNA